MIETEIIDDIRKYEKKAFYGLTLRQAICLGVGVALGTAIIFLPQFSFIPKSMQYMLSMIIAVVCVLIKKKKPYSLNFETFIISFFVNNILSPPIRCYKVKNPYYKYTLRANWKMSNSDKKRYGRKIFKRKAGLKAYR